jgi:type II secretory pathway pseudopilin PulG
MRALFRFHSLAGRHGRGGVATQAGFTLVELMVSMTGGLFLTIVVFALSRDVSRFYQSENRVANATLSGFAGFERLSSDLARAGHLSTPNITADPHVCNRPQPGWPPALVSLRALEIDDDVTKSGPTEVGAAGINPRRVLITGALNTPEVLTTSGVGPAAGGFWQISIDMTKPSALRVGLGLAPAAAGNNLLVLQRIFMAPDGTGRIVRLRDHGNDQYGIVQDVTVGPGAANVNLAPNPQLVRAQAGGLQCGIPGNGTAMDLSVIDIVRYDIRSMTGDPAYAALYRASGLSGGGTSNAPPPFESTRAELVRVELNTALQEIPGTAEIVAEYAVGLNFNVWRATAPNNPLLLQDLGPVPNTYLFTQLIRGVHVQVSVRSREADRRGDIPGSTLGTQRIKLGTANDYARVRTFQADIPLRNLENGNW